MLKLSKREKILFGFLNNKPQTVAKISHKYFKGDVPFEGSNRIASALKRLKSKFDNYDKASCQIVVEIPLGDGRQRTYRKEDK